LIFNNTYFLSSNIFPLSKKSFLTFSEEANQVFFAILTSALYKLSFKNFASQTFKRKRQNNLPYMYLHILMSAFFAAVPYLAENIPCLGHPWLNFTTMKLAEIFF
jgi:hypothetical protein